jgi:superfamily II DNA or RNA helicase
MRTLEDVDPGLGYNTSDDDLVEDFYVACLDVSTSYDRAVGYFRSSIYHLVGAAISRFVLRGGRVRIVCSPDLTGADVRAAMEALQHRQISASLEREIREILRFPENRPVVELLGALLQSGQLDFRIAYRPTDAGIYHEKLGLFRGPSDIVSFTGSSNETFRAWDPDGNHENLEVFVSWEQRDARRVERHNQYFESLWAGEVSGLTVCALPEVPREILEAHAPSDGVEGAWERARQRVRRERRRGVRSPRPLLPHQVAVLQTWEDAGRRGIVDHATGAGKTVTAIDGIRRWLTEDGSVCLVVVPTSLLSVQWQDTLRDDLEALDPQLLAVGGRESHPRWREYLGSFTNPGQHHRPRIVVATLQSARSDAFLARLGWGPHLLVVADEVHHLGATQSAGLMAGEPGAAIGLSATPQRYGDPSGTEAIFRFFGEVLPPPFGIREAIAAGRLVPYDYYPQVVALGEDEASRWTALSERIRRAMGPGFRQGRGGVSDLSDAAKRLLIERARIAKKASAKPGLARDVLEDEWADGDRWLVYCDDRSQLNLVRDCLAAIGPTLEYHSSMRGAPDATLRRFERHGGILVAIRCLDEGVDIPAVDRALILASSTNPREYVQRRGRVLRSAPGKHSARIYDALVALPGDDGDESVLTTELDRAETFARNARNEASRYVLARLRADATPDVTVGFEDELGETEGDDDSGHHPR